ncbi:MAG: RNA 2',3'-cyclic phosphodiesterase [Deltaproteobacteria bacterium]|nr:RNA 2',3'-cyclic phosphodiesterase [Deltaproteobacteria bacterium]
MIRAFIAVTLAESVIEEIAKIRSALQETRADVRWTRLEGLHLTLKFLGDLDRNRIEPVLEVLRETAHGGRPLQVTAQGMGAFPNSRRPRTVWVGLHGQGLAALNAELENALMSLDFPPDAREFTPHLTLGRVRSLRGWERMLPVMKAHEQTVFGESTIHYMTLYRSDLRPEGAVYTRLGAAAFQPGP